VRCDVDRCTRPALVLVTFTSGITLPYCHWHAFKPKGGALRWDPWTVSAVVNLGGAE
jgi:hypothetical protein